MKKTGFVGACALGLIVTYASCNEPRVVRCGDLVCPVGAICQGGRCVVPCGNGVIDNPTIEECDDGNLRSGDGCSSTCKTEAPFWQRLLPADPPIFAIETMVYDSARDRLVSFGISRGEMSFREHDGMQWRSLALPTTDREWKGSTLGYHPARRSTVLLGGPGFDRANTSETPGETWEYDGVRWTKVATAISPALSEHTASAYHAARGQWVLFSYVSLVASAHVPARNEMWVYDGSWTKVTLTGDPPAVLDNPRFSMAYDASRQVIVLGMRNARPSDASGDSADTVLVTWEWDGARWNKIETGTDPQHKPPPGGTMVYDTRQRRIVYYGGRVTTDERGSADARGDIWAYDPSKPHTERWSTIATVGTVPIARAGAAMTYDPARRQIVLHGGDSDPDAQTGLLNDTWAFDGQAGTWTELPDTVYPEPRAAPVVVHDTLRAKTYFWSGIAKPDACPKDLPLHKTVWVWEGNGDAGKWVDASPLGIPAGRAAAAAFDEKNGRTIFVVELAESCGPPPAPVFGTFAFDGARFTRIDASTPRLGYFGGAVYDRARERVVVYGGEIGGSSNPGPAPLPGQQEGTIITGVWELDGSTWIQRELGGPSPLPRTEIKPVYDPKRQRTVVFGGVTEARLSHALLRHPELFLRELWLLDGQGWKEVTTDDKSTWPTARFGSATAYYPLLDRIVVTSGDGLDANGNPIGSEFWLLDPGGANPATIWSQPDIQTTRPPQTRSPTLVYDPTAKSLLLVGGDVYESEAGTWRFRYQVTPSTPERCDGTDADQDGLVDCADPDCDQVSCGPALMRCIDNTCKCAGGNVEKHCGDKVDDDCDGKVDCDDSDCQDSAYCKGESDCQDGQDNDNDGATDCLDPGCHGVGPCEQHERSCSDGIDNDGDGMTDCEDPDCFLVGCNDVVDKVAP